MAKSSFYSSSGATPADVDTIADSVAAAAASEAAAAASETAADASETAAAISAAAAAASALAASDSETAAGASETAAAASAAAAAASYDDFDDRYLGAKASEPTLDNDGNALATGALYFNTSSTAMFVYTGTVWASLAGGGGGGITDIVQDLTPQLGGDLDLNGNSLLTLDVTGASTLNDGVLIKPDGTLDFQIVHDAYGTGSTKVSYSQLLNYNTAGSGPEFYFSVARGTEAAPATTQSGDFPGGFLFGAHDGTGFRYTSGIFAEISGAVSTGVVPQRLGFYTGTVQAAALATPKMIIDSDGNVGIGTSTPTGKLVVRGDQSSFYATDRDDAYINLDGYENGVTTGAVGYAEVYSYNDNNFGDGWYANYGRGSKASPAAVQVDDTVAVAGPGFYSGSTQVYAATMGGIVDGAVSAGVVPTGLYFTTGSNNATEDIRLQISSSGVVQLANDSRLYIQGNAVTYNPNSFYNIQLDALTGDYNQNWFIAKEGVNQHIAAFTYADSGSHTEFELTSYTTTNYAGGYLLRAARGTPAAKSALVDNDNVGYFAGYGYDGASWRGVGGMDINIDGTVGSNIMPSELVFKTRSTGVGDVPAARMTIASDGLVSVTGETRLYGGVSNNNAFFNVNGYDVTGGGQIYAWLRNWVGSETYAEGFYSEMARGSFASPAAVQTGDYLLMFTGGFYDGVTDNIFQARIEAVVDGAVSAGSVPAAMQFKTGTNNNPPVRLAIASDGLITMGNYAFNNTQTVGAGQDNYVLTYDHATGLIGLESAAAGGGGDLLAANNLSDLASAATARTNLGLAIGTDVQAYSAVLAATTASFLVADETKLDGIEAGADVTDTANVTAAGALMDSELTDIAAIKAASDALAADVNAGTSTTAFVTPDALAGSNFGTQVVQLLVFDDATDTAVGDGAGDLFFRVPSTMNGMNLVSVAACVQTAGTTGTTDIQVHNVTQAADMLTTKITIDSAETDSSTAAVAAVIDTANDDVATGDRLRIDVDAVSTTAAKGLLVELQFRLP